MERIKRMIKLQIEAIKNLIIWIKKNRRGH